MNENYIVNYSFNIASSCCIPDFAIDRFHEDIKRLIKKINKFINSEDTYSGVLISTYEAELHGICSALSTMGLLVQLERGGDPIEGE